HMRSLVAPPSVALALPAGPGGLGETEMTADLSDHPWAGARVRMVLKTHDEGGNEGRSDPIEITLPAKHFVKPLAAALAEQRRDLILFPDDKDRVEMALQALMMAPQMFKTSTSVYLGLDVAMHMLHRAKSDDDLRATADFLWNMALQIENGSLSDAERALRDAEKKLRDALQNNASDAEIRKLTENLQAAMNKFLNEFARQQQHRQNAQSQSPSGPNGAKSISRKDLQAMLDRMREMAQAGDRASAQKMLEQLQNTLDNLAMAQQQQGDPARQQMRRALNQLDRMMQEQQSLRDKTHRQGQSQQQEDEGQEPQQGFGQEEPDQQEQGQGQQGMDQQGQQGRRGQSQFGMGGNEALRQQQQALRDRLEQLQKQLRQRGQDQQGLDDAGRAMKQAEKGLAQGNRRGNDAAVGAQGKALQALRKGAEQLARQMQGQGNGQGPDGSPEAEQEGGTDPLGRPMGAGSAFNPNSRYDPLGVPAAQRAQSVLEELRRRLSDPSRPREEMDYLERLLKRY
ncbi:MAG: TIGR02302 family protein, partial [Beijerinckiaceae bacterium]